MAWEVVMGEDGIVTLPADLIDKLGWTPDTPLRWVDGDEGVTLEPSDPDATNEPGRDGSPLA